MTDYKKDLTPETFENVVAYILSEPGAMGCSGTVHCLNNDGSVFAVDYREEQTSWERLKEYFAAINGCRFFGPAKDVDICNSVLFIGFSKGTTYINEGWKEICFDCGNHFIVREKDAKAFLDLFNGLTPCEVICDGFDIVRKEELYKQL